MPGRAVLLPAIALAVLAVAATARGGQDGGWAVATVHPLAAAPVAGRPATIAYSLRQHGITPLRLDGTGIEIVAADGRVTRFPGRPRARAGRYAATVTFPTAGLWRWRAVSAFGVQELGRIAVAAADATGARPRLDGRELFRAKGCETCHVGAAGEASPVGAGPSLDGLADRLQGAAGLAYVRQSIRDPDAVHAAAGRMPLLEVSDAEVRALAHYLLTP